MKTPKQLMQSLGPIGQVFWMWFMPTYYLGYALLYAPKVLIGAFRGFVMAWQDFTK